MRVLTCESFIVELVPNDAEYQPTDADLLLFEPYQLEEVPRWLQAIESPFDTADARADLRDRARRARQASSRLRAEAERTRLRSNELRYAARIWARLRAGDPSLDLL
jgi:hypothetical protein